jgi:extracellular factor (EF) 3-hydroxypalmitic acid methyl ester biosynthesis protein
MGSLASSTEKASWSDSDGFRGTDGDIIQRILPLSLVDSYRKGQAVLLKEADSRSLYYVQEGAVEVYHTRHETRIVVALIGKDDFFGEIGFFDGETRVRDVRVTEDSIIRTIDQETLRKVQHKDPILYGNFLALLTERICVKFRRVLEEREPLTAYAASLSTGRKSFEESKPLPDHFLKTPEWTRISKVVENFKAKFYDLSYGLQKDKNPEIPQELYDRCHSLLDELSRQLQESANLQYNAETHDYIWGYVFKEIFPYYMRSRFAERAYFKPQGYAGDFMMMEMIYKNEPEGDGKLGVVVDSWCLNTRAARAVRGRRHLLSRELERLASERVNQGDSIRIMNLACGSNRELFDFLGRCNYSEKIEALCIDVDPSALEYTNRYVNILPHRASVRLMSDNIVKWSLGRVRQNIGLQDIIYSSGLTDYLDDRLFIALVNRCYEQLKPGGTLMVGNFGLYNPDRAFMDYVLHWRLIHRGPDDLKAIFDKTPFGGNVDVIAEDQGVNLFVVAMKEA